MKKLALALTIVLALGVGVTALPVKAEAAVSENSVEARSAARCGYSNVSGLRIRREANTSSTVLGQYQKGDKIKILNNGATTNGFYKVERDGVRGYVYAGYVTLAGLY